MAKTIQGIEFFLLAVTPAEGAEHSLSDLRDTAKALIRSGDAVIEFQGNIYIAVATDVQGASKAARRLLQTCRSKGIEAKVRLLPEPYTEEIIQVTGTIIQHDVPLYMRTEPTDLWK